MGEKKFCSTVGLSYLHDLSAYIKSYLLDKMSGEQSEIRCSEQLHIPPTVLKDMCFPVFERPQHKTRNLLH